MPTIETTMIRSTQDDANARIRHDAKPIEVLPLESPRSAYIELNTRIRLFLGREKWDTDAKSYLMTHDDIPHLYIPDIYKDHQSLIYFDGRMPGSEMTSRFCIGASRWFVRCCFHLTYGHMICLPTDPDAQHYIHFFRLQTPQEWAVQPGYEFKRVLENWDQTTTHEGQRLEQQAQAERLKHEGWETYIDARTAHLWARRKI